MAAKPAALIRRKLDQRQLPLGAPAKVWAGYGSGSLCDGCDAVIFLAQVEYGFTIDEQTLRFHVGCYGLWGAECRGRGLRRLGSN